MRRALSALVLAFAVPAASAQEVNLFSLGAGDLGGGYFAAARSICAAINRQNEQGLRCSPEPTQGSLYNIAMLRAGELDMALVQSDLLHAAVTATGLFEKDPEMEVRSVLSLYPEMLTVLAASGSGIRRLDDLAGRRVDIGLPASGRNATIRTFLRRLGIDVAGYADFREMAPQQSLVEFCSGAIDAILLVVGHPDRRVADLMARCDARLVPFKGPRVDPLIAEAEEYALAQIPAGMYGTSPAVRTAAVYATLAVRVDTPTEWVRVTAETILGDIESLTSDAPVLAGFVRENAASVGLSAPLHPGAVAALEGTGG